MVLVATIALGSSTYAWFASNSKVTATGMQVQATAEGGIEITKVVAGAKGDYSTIADLEMTKGSKLLPTSTAGSASGSVITGKWFHATASVAGASAAKDGTYTEYTPIKGINTKLTANSTDVYQDVDQFYDANGNQYFLVGTYNIRSVSSAKLAKNLIVKSVTVTDADTATSAALDKSLRVAIVTGANTVIYAPYGYDGSDETGVTYNSGKTAITYSVAKTLTDGSATATDAVTALLATTESDSLVATVSATDSTVSPATDGELVSIYVYYEGEDYHHFSNNITATLDTLSVTVEFAATVE